MNKWIEAMSVSAHKIKRARTRHYVTPDASTTHCVGSSLARKLKSNLISHLDLTTKVQEIQVGEKRAPCQMGMTSGKCGLS